MWFLTISQVFSGNFTYIFAEKTVIWMKSVSASMVKCDVKNFERISVEFCV